MTKNNMHWGVIATATLTIAGAMVSPQAMAKHHGKAHAAAAAEAYAAPSTNSRVDALEAQLQAMQSELSSLRAAQSRPSTESAKVQELDEWAQSVKAKPAKSDTKDNMVFFRGGYAHMFRGRDDLLTGNQTVLQSGVADKGAWDLGAGFDFSLNDNLFGLMPNTEVLAELMFEYKKFGTQHAKAVAPGATNTLCATAFLAGGANPNLTGSNCSDVTVSQFTLSAAPKIKFMKGNNFRPWLIPVGLAMHVISPPSNGVTVFNPGAMFAVGADYKIWKDIYVGADARYHWTASDADGVKTDGYTTTGYLGIGF